MQIAKLSIRDFLGIEALEFQPGKINMIEGGNGEGKSVVLEAIEQAVTNKNRRVRLVRDGANKYVILVEMDDETTIKRQGTGPGSENTVDVKTGGIPRKSPQAWLSSIAGSYSFNPVDFILEKPEKQAKMLLGLLPVQVAEEEVREWLGFLPAGIDYDAHGLEVCGKLYDVVYEMRRQANADVKSLEAQLRVESAKVPGGFKTEAYRNLNLTDKFDELGRAQAHNAEIERVRDSIPAIEAQVQSYAQKNETLQVRLDDLKRQMADTVKQMAANNREADALRAKVAETHEKLAGMESIDTTALQDEIRTFQENQRLVHLKDHCDELKDQLALAEETASGLDERCKMLKRKPQELIGSVTLPIKGLGLEDGQVTINGLPIVNLSTSERVRLALEIARASAGELKVVCVDGFEALDPAAQAEFMRQAEGDGFQYFVTMRTEGPLQVSVIQD